LIGIVIQGRPNRVLGSYDLNEFYEASSLLEFEAVGNILDVVAPYNVSTIPNWKCLPESLRGKTISNAIFKSFLRIAGEDIP